MDDEHMVEMQEIIKHKCRTKILEITSCYFATN